MRNQTLTIICGLITLNLHAQTPGQDTSLRQQTIEVIQAYKPEIRAMARPLLAPVLPAVDTNRPNFNYAVPQQTLRYVYRALPLRPLMLDRDSFSLPYPGYARFGFGNLATFFVDAGTAHLKGERFRSAFQFRHMSQKGKETYQKSGLTDLIAAGDYVADRHRVHADAHLLHHRYYTFGFLPGLASYTEADLRQRYTGFQIGGLVANRDSNRNGLNYQPSIRVAYYGSRDNRETALSYSVPMQYAVDSSLTFHFGVTGQHATVSRQQDAISNQLFSVGAGLQFRKGNWSGLFSVAPTFGSYPSLAVLPDILVTYHKPETPIRFRAGWVARIETNTYQQLTQNNPFLNAAYAFRQTRSDEWYAGVAVNAGAHLMMHGRLAFHAYKDLPLYLNDTGDARTFYLVYEPSANAASIQVGLQYEHSQRWSLRATARLYRFWGFDAAHLWHVPASDIRAEGAYRPSEDWLLTAYASLLGGIYGRDVFRNAVNLEPVVDIGFGGEYRMLPRLSLFLRVTNLLNAENQRWMGYSAYGFNIFGGIRFYF